MYVEVKKQFISKKVAEHGLNEVVARVACRRAIS